MAGTAALPLENTLPFALGMANTIFYHWKKGESVSLLTLLEDGYAPQTIYRHHADAIALAYEWAQEYPHIFDKQALLASEIPTAPSDKLHPEPKPRAQ